MIRPKSYALFTMHTRYVFENNSNAGHGEIAPDCNSGVAVLARQHAARQAAAEEAAQQAAAEEVAREAVTEEAAQQASLPDPQSLPHDPPA